LLEACRAVPEVRPGVRCPTGEARITPGFDLAPWVIHTVGPVYRDGRSGEPELLANCYRHALELARERGLESIAFPSISTGVFGYPIEDAARIAVATVRAEAGPNVRFVCFSAGDLAVYRALLAE
jgi:O-acetyl-ADP-ribose deacetylase (regulator of RNase III)